MWLILVVTKVIQKPFEFFVLWDPRLMVATSGIIMLFHSLFKDRTGGYDTQYGKRLGAVPKAMMFIGFLCNL